MLEQAAIFGQEANREESPVVPSKSCHQWPKFSLLALFLKNSTTSQVALQPKTKALELSKNQIVT